MKTYYKDQEFMKQVGEKIRAERNAKGLTQELLANECGIDYSQINRMELGKVNFSISMLAKIANALNISPTRLLPY